MRRFFISPEKIAIDVPVITGPDAAHIIQVLRYKAGDIIGLFDGKGGEYEAEILAVSPGQVKVSIIRRRTGRKDPSVHITVAQGYLKEKKMDTVVRQLSEIGAMCWMPFKAKRSVVNLDSKRLAARKQRWEKIAIEAAKQCGRNRVMSIEPANSYTDLLNRSSQCDQRIVFWENASQSLKNLVAVSDSSLSAVTQVIILLGPEGGFDLHEVRMAKENGFIIAGLGPRILRAETAAIVACTLTQYIFGDLNQQST